MVFINDVSVVMGQGFLSDHYNPSAKAVGLTADSYLVADRSLRLLFAAHECGHAVQHAKAYSMLQLQLRSKLVLVGQFSSNVQRFCLWE